MFTVFCATLLATTLAGSAIPASASLTSRPHNKPAQVIPGRLIYYGGPVQNTPRVYVVFWDWTSDPSGERPYLLNFLSSVGGTPWLATISQYSAGWTGDLLAGTWSDPTPIPASPSEDQLGDEAAAAVAHFGVGTSPNAQIVVATPTGHSPPGFGKSFCSEHFSTNNTNISYTVLPYMTDAGKVCGEGAVNGPSGTLDGVSISEGHELAESITDPLGASTDPQLYGWRDASKNEVADKCVDVDLTNITTSAGRFAVQSLWSNTANGCVVASIALPGAAAGVNHDGRLEIFGLATGGAVYHNWQTTPGGSWSGWYPLGSDTGFTSVAAATNADGRLEAFATGPDGVVYHDYQTDTSQVWSGWFPLASDTGFTSVAAATNADGRLEAFATGPDGVVYHNYQTDTSQVWSGWFPLASDTGFTSVGAGRNFDGRLEVFATGPAGRVYHDWQTIAGGTWSGWFPLGNQVTLTGVAAVANADGRLQAFATQANGLIVENQQQSPGGDWSGWQLLPGVGSNSSVAATISTDGRLQIFSNARDGVIYTSSQLAPGGNWSGWTPLGAP